MTSSPDPKAVVRHQLDLAKNYITHARRDDRVPRPAGDALLALQTAVEALAVIVMREQNADENVGPQSVPTGDDHPNIRTMGF
jgi:hypothetical protein